MHSHSLIECQRIECADFIASLAVSDFLIGLFSMPLYTAYLLLDENWVLGSVVCNLWCAHLLPPQLS